MKIRQLPEVTAGLGKLYLSPLGDAPGGEGGSRERLVLRRAIGTTLSYSGYVRLRACGCTPSSLV